MPRKAAPRGRHPVPRNLVDWSIVMVWVILDLFLCDSSWRRLFHPYGGFAAAAAASYLVRTASRLLFVVLIVAADGSASGRPASSFLVFLGDTWCMKNDGWSLKAFALEALVNVSPKQFHSKSKQSHHIQYIQNK
jgi:hypothetical protein